MVAGPSLLIRPLSRSRGLNPVLMLPRRRLRSIRLCCSSLRWLAFGVYLSEDSRLSYGLYCHVFFLSLRPSLASHLIFNSLIPGFLLPFHQRRRSFCLYLLFCGRTAASLDLHIGLPWDLGKGIETGNYRNWAPGLGTGGWGGGLISDRRVSRRFVVGLF